jgi:hypothetical protein
MVEPQDGNFNFEELDYQVKKAQENNVEIIFALGKRLPRWPECHIPEWALNLSSEEQEQKILIYIQKIIERYDSYDAIKIWQVENEPFLSVFAKDHCFDFSKKFLKKEIELVKSLDSKNRPILITDSGELSLWVNAYRFGDMLGTTMYVYSWNSIIDTDYEKNKPSIFIIKIVVFTTFSKVISAAVKTAFIFSITCLVSVSISSKTNSIV